MPGINISKKDLESLLKKSIRIDELDELLHIVKGEVKEVTGDDIKVDLDDTNRPDLFCVEGIARELKGHKINVGAYRNTPKFQIIVDSKLQNIRPYIGGFIAKNVSLTEESLAQLIQTQEKLTEIYGKRRKNISIGVYKADEIEFPVFFRACAPESRKFIPLDFDRELNLKEILELHPKGREYAYTLSCAPMFPILEDNKNTILSFPPIINSSTVGKVEAGDGNLFVDVTGMFVEQVILVINILAQNFRDRGAEIIPVNIKYPYKTPLGANIPLPLNINKKMTINISEFERLLGIQLKPEKIKKELGKSSYEVKASGKKLTITPPAYRYDIMHPVDIIEDFAIRYGYNNFKPTELEEFTVGKSIKMAPAINKFRKLMLGAGFEEIVSNILTSKEQLLETNRLIEVENPVAETYSVLRNSIIPSLLSVESISSKSMYPHKIFELGEVVVEDSSVNYGNKTLLNLCALISYPEASFSDLHSILDVLSYYTGINYELKKVEDSLFIKGRVANVVVNNKAIGTIGEIHPQVLESWKIRNPVVVFELQDLKSFVI